jgi:hypothetical protein
VQEAKLVPARVSPKKTRSVFVHVEVFIVNPCCLSF